MAKNESYYAYVTPDTVKDYYISAIKEKGGQSATGRARLCFHNSPDEPLHLMLIYHDQRTQVPIHRHEPFGEYIIVLDGALEVTTYHSDFRRDKSHNICSGMHPTPYWIPPNVWHSFKFENPTLFYEISEGPINGKTTYFADRT